MADAFDPNQADDEFEPNAAERGYAEEPPEVEEEEQPRRAASARFIVDSEVGSEALLRDAMDPANQSLADALRLSFRVLQAVIVVLVILFLASGFKTVEDGFSGVRTVWGRITGTLSPGLQFSPYPYPAGEFVIFKAENRTVDLGEYFSMASRGRPRQTIMDQTEVSTPLNPGGDGSLITRDGDLAHLEVTAKYEIDQPMDFVHCINDAEAKRNADEIVKMALRRAAVHVVGGMTVAEIIEPARVPEIRDNLRSNAQATLDEIKCGIRIVDVTSATGSAPYAIQKAMAQVQESGVEAGAIRADAEKAANQLLQNMAGNEFQRILDLIDGYEDALDSGDAAKSEAIFASIQGMLDGDGVTGEVSDIINRARSYRTQIESTLGNEYQRFNGLLALYKKNPQLVIRQQWLEAYAAVISRPDTEVVYVPSMLASIDLSMVGSFDVQDQRNDMRRAAKENAANMANYQGPFVATGANMSINEAGRQLERTKTGALRPTGTGN